MSVRHENSINITPGQSLVNIFLFGYPREPLARTHPGIPEKWLQDTYLQNCHKVEGVRDGQSFHVGIHEAFEVFVRTQDVEAEQVSKNSGRRQNGDNKTVCDEEFINTRRILVEFTQTEIRHFQNDKTKKMRFSRQ